MKTPALRLRTLTALLLALTLPVLLAGCGHKSRVRAPASSKKATSTSRTTSRAPRTASKEIKSPPRSARGKIVAALVASVPEPGPPIRIGLATQEREVRISAPGDFYLVEKIPEAAKIILRGEVQIKVEHGAAESSGVYRVQVVSLSNREAAEELRKKLDERFSLPVYVRQSANSATAQIRIGEFPTQEEAQRFATGSLAEAGYPQSFVVRESSDVRGGEARLALRGPASFFRVSRVGYLFMPVSENGILRLGGKPYRGIFDLSLNREGRMTVVNQLGVEEYLMGVVPAEISPTRYPEPAAMAVQAIAARTYALRNMGRFSSEGFDLTADERTQVYPGASIEHGATNEAVQGTHGLAIYHQGELINALYSSTCGGKTEDFSNVFDGPPVPYLTSVSCTVESSSGSEPGASLKSKNDMAEVVFADDGTLANRNLELASVLGIVEARKLSPDFLSETPAVGEVRNWVGKAQRLSRKPITEDPPASKDIRSRAGFIRYAAEMFFGSREISQRISSTDAAYYLTNLKDGAQVPAAARSAFAYLMQKGLWRPYPDNTARPMAPIRRIDALALLARWIVADHPDILWTGVFQDLQARSLLVKQGNRTRPIPLADALRVFRLAEGVSTPVESVRLIGGEKLSFHVRPDGKVDFLEVELNPTGAASDRFSPQATWQVTLSRQTVSEKLRPLAAKVGEVKDLAPSRLGRSGRTVQMEVEGSRGSVVLNGYRVRMALGLKDTLFTISRNRGADGSIESFTFDGRGWGHGVGLCQVGAFGMARAGRSYEEILKTYYHGVELRKAY